MLKGHVLGLFFGSTWIMKQIMVVHMGDDDDWSFHVDLSWVIKEREESGI